MRDECLICHAPLKYLTEDTEMVCAMCGKQEHSKTKCISGHYVCSSCHMHGAESIFTVCMQATEADPVLILERLMALPFCHMHGPEHHVMVGSALLTAYKNAGGTLELPKALAEMSARGKAVPGGACGFWGACGAGISAGMYVSILTQATPLAGEAWGLSNEMTAAALARIGSVGGPRCCKRDSYLAVTAAAEFTEKRLGVTMPLSKIRCTRFEKNHHCIRQRCPFFPKEEP